MPVRQSIAPCCYRWIEAVPIRDGEDAVLVNWIGFEIVDAKGRVKYSMAWVTSLPISKDNVAEIVACGRARWKIENESFNVLKNQGYELEHSFGHGQKFLVRLSRLSLLARPPRSHHQFHHPARTRKNQGSPAFEAAMPILSQLLKAETAERDVRSVANRIKAARFPSYKDLAGFDFASSEANEALVRQLHRCAFIDSADNAVLIGGRRFLFVLGWHLMGKLVLISLVEVAVGLRPHASEICAVFRRIRLKPANLSPDRLSAHEVHLDQNFSVPLVLDLDGTLLATDTLHECLLRHLRRNPLDIVIFPVWALAGRAQFKARFADALTQEDIDALPVTADIVHLAQKESEKGRKIILATAANRAIADMVAVRFSFISEVLASDATNNLKGGAKAALLEQLYPNGFIYAGDSEADLDVWRKAKGAIVVERGDRLSARAGKTTRVVSSIRPEARRRSILRRTMRLHQWAKNALVFVPLVLGGQFFSPHAWLAAMLAFFAMSLLASGTYIANDMWDLAEDRLHWSKKKRPLASGQLPLASGLVLLTGCGLTAILLAALDGPGAVAALGVYLLMSLLYSYKFKREPIVDVLLLAGMFTMRLVLGQVVTGVALSPWLLVFSMFIFLSLSLIKRHTEVARMVDHGHKKVLGRGYMAGDAPMLLMLGVASSMSAVLIMILYLIEEAFQANFYRHSAMLWGFPIIVFLFLGRMWLLCQRNEIHDDPVAFALKDRVSLFYALSAVALFTAAVAPV